MSYRFKGNTIVLDADEIKFEPKPLPQNPKLHQIVVDESDSKLKVFQGSRWLILGEASDIYFNNSNSTLISEDTEAAIKEVENKTMKRRDIISFSVKGNASNHWLAQNGLSASTNKTFFTPPYSCKILRVAFSNDKSGSNETPLHSKLTLHHKHYSEFGDITTSHPISWYVTSEENVNRINYGENGRTWVYDSSSEGDVMDVDYRYALRIIKLSGNVKPHNVTINIYIEEA